tara:strand:- start:54854 stop:55120 length:267 start_codon:yes stop_codon:yes gene_type:complete
MKTQRFGRLGGAGKSDVFPLFVGYLHRASKATVNLQFSVDIAWRTGLVGASAATQASLFAAKNSSGSAHGRAIEANGTPMLDPMSRYP